VLFVAIFSRRSGGGDLGILQKYLVSPVPRTALVLGKGLSAVERQMMRAEDLMTADVVTVGPAARVEEIARLLLEHQISAVPVVDATGQLVGIVSEGDLVRRAETGTLPRRAWWLELLRDPAVEARDMSRRTAAGRRM
jgi:CBS domain-containing protein